MTGLRHTETTVSFPEEEARKPYYPVLAKALVRSLRKVTGGLGGVMLKLLVSLQSL